MTVTLYEHPFASYCWKVLIALYERDVPFERVLVEDRAALAEIWPLATIPVLVDGDLVLPESTAIVEHLGGLVPDDPVGARDARLWDRLCDGHVMTPMQKIVADGLRAPGQEDPTGVADARAQLDRAYALLDGHLADADAWIAGDAFGLADCAAAPALFYARVVHRWDEREHPRLTRYFARVRARPSVARVIDEARPYRPLFPLPWPDGID
jgi:glutathione S-transferase